MGSLTPRLGRCSAREGRGLFEMPELREGLRSRTESKGFDRRRNGAEGGKNGM